MSKSNNMLVDAAQLGIAAARAFAGDFTAAAMQAVKWRKVITGIIVGIAFFIILIATLIASIPSLMMQAIMPGESYKSKALFASDQIISVRKESDSIFNEIQEWVSQVLSETIGDSAAGGDHVVKSIDADIDYQDVLILYNVKFGGYGLDEEMDLDKVRMIARLFIKKASSFGKEETGELTLKITASLRPFADVMKDLGLNEMQTVVALNMYNCLHFNQMTTYMEGNDPVGIDLKDITFTESATAVTYFSQMDKRWNKEPYGRTGTIGQSGCGPTAISIVISSLSNKLVTPLELSNWAYQNGYKCEGNGSYHSLIPAAAKQFNLSVEGASTQEAQKIVDALAEGKLVVAIMSKGHFTSGGHFIVLRGVTEEGQILVADPASLKRSQQEWDLRIILGEANRRAGSGGPFWIIGR